MEASGENIARLERLLGHNLDYRWLGTYDPLVTLKYRQHILGHKYSEHGLQPQEFSDQAHREEGLVPALQAYDQPYGIDRYFTLPTSLKEIYNAQLGDLAKYEIHEFERHGKSVQARVLRLQQFERMEHFDPDQFFGLNLFSGFLTFQQFRETLLVNDLLAKLIERQLKDPSCEAYLVTWQGSKVPGGLCLSGHQIAWTQHGTVLDCFSKEVGNYQRLVEFGGEPGDVQVMLIVIDKARLDWGDILRDLIDRDIGSFRKNQDLSELINPDPGMEYSLILRIGSKQISSWKFPNEGIRRKFLAHLADSFDVIRTNYSPDRHGQSFLDIRHPDLPEITGSLYTFEQKPYRYKP